MNETRIEPVAVYRGVVLFECRGMGAWLQANDMEIGGYESDEDLNKILSDKPSLWHGERYLCDGGIWLLSPEEVIRFDNERMAKEFLDDDAHLAGWWSWQDYCTAVNQPLDHARPCDQWDEEAGVFVESWLRDDYGSGKTGFMGLGQ